MSAFWRNRLLIVMLITFQISKKGGTVAAFICTLKAGLGFFSGYFLCALT